MERTKLYKNKIQMVVYTTIFIICLILCIIIGTKDYSKDKEPDNIRFSDLYNRVSTDNIYKFINVSDAYTIINGRSGIILFGFPNNEWTNYYAQIINEVAKEEGIKEISYYDFLSDRSNNNGTYETIVNKLSRYVLFDDLDDKDILAPTLVVVKNGQILGYFDSLSYRKGSITPDGYFSSNVVSELKEELRLAFIEYKK